MRRRRGGEGRGGGGVRRGLLVSFINVLLCNGYAVVVVEERKLMADGAWCHGAGLPTFWSELFDIDNLGGGVF